MRLFNRMFLSTILLLSTMNTLLSQWVQITGPQYNVINCFAVIPATDGSGVKNLYAGNWDGMFLSTDYGASWTRSGLSGKSIVALTTCPAPAGNNGTNLYAGTYYDNVYISTDYGTRWTQVKNRLALDITGLAIIDTNLFFATNGSGIYLSNPNSPAWSHVDKGISAYRFMDLTVIDKKLYAATLLNGMFRSTDYGNTWTQINNIQFLWHLKATQSSTPRSDGIFIKFIFASTMVNTLYRSTDDGTTWVQILDLSPYCATSFTSIDSNIFMGTTGGVYYSSNNGTSWITVNEGLPSLGI